MNGKKMVTLALALVLTLCAFAPAMAEIVRTGAEDGSLNVRKGPGTSYGIAAWVKNGQRITVLENTEPWAKIKVDANGKIGYIKNAYIVSNDDESWKETEAESAAYDLGSVKTRYAASFVNVRKGPGTAYAKDFAVKSGERLNILGESGNWYLVKAQNGKTGYISKNYVSEGIKGIAAANVNLRSGAGTAFATHGIIAKGTTLIQNAVKGNWTNVTVNGETGYIYTKYIK